MQSAPHVHVHRVTYHECTVGDHVYYGRYFDILEEARGEYFRSLGRSFREWQECGHIFPVIEVEAKYRRMAHYDDVLAVEVRVIRLERIRIDFQYRISRQGEDGLLFEGVSRHVCADLGGKPCRVPEELEEAIREEGARGPRGS